jgi:hypothetical protein
MKLNRLMTSIHINKHVLTSKFFNLTALHKTTLTPVFSFIKMSKLSDEFYDMISQYYANI